MLCPDVISPYPYNTYTCSVDTFYINYIISKLLNDAPYFQYLRTGVDNSSKYRNQYSYIVPIYHFKYYAQKDFPNTLLKTYTYEELFNISLVANQYPNPNQIPSQIKDKMDNIDIEVYCSIILFNNLDKLYNAVRIANEYKQKGLQYFFTYNVPKILCNTSYYFPQPPEGQKLSKCYTGPELITISRNTNNIIHSYENTR